MPDTSMIGKITIRTINVIPAKSVEVGKSTPIARIFGMASGIKQVVDKVRGDTFESITGQFGAVNLQTGNAYESGVLYLPKGIHDMIEAAVRSIPKDAPSSTVDFALEIRVVKADNPAGYSYEAVNLIPAKVVSPLEELRKQIAASAPMFALPTSTESPAKGAKK